VLVGAQRPFQIAHVLFVSTLTVEPLLLAVKEFVLGISGFKRPPPQLEAAVDGGSRAGLPRVTCGCVHRCVKREGAAPAPPQIRWANPVHTLYSTTSVPLRSLSPYVPA